MNTLRERRGDQRLLVSNLLLLHIGIIGRCHSAGDELVVVEQQLNRAFVRLQNDLRLVQLLALRAVLLIDLLKSFGVGAQFGVLLFQLIQQLFGRQIGRAEEVQAMPLRNRIGEFDVQCRVVFVEGVVLIIADQLTNRGKVLRGIFNKVEDTTTMINANQLVLAILPAKQEDS